MAEPTVLGERYELDDKLGSGGMSTVYEARDRILERTVAVKVLAEHLSDDDRFVARFRREALAVARLLHPNIVQVYDTGEDDGRYFIVMERVLGRSGSQILRSEGILDPTETIEIGVQACAGLEYAHRNGVIHRDIKPGNLMVTGGPAGSGELICKITDFGIAKAVEQTRITQVGSVVGTAAYLAPEQVRGEEATPATDVYALGVVLYQFLTGRLPYEGSSLAELAIRQQNEKPLPPETYNSDVPVTVSTAVMRALNADPDVRYASAAEMSEGLERGLRGEDVTVAMAAAGKTTSTGYSRAEAATRPLERSARSAQRPLPPPSVPIPPRPTVTRRSPSARAARFLSGLLALVLIAALVAGVVTVLTDDQVTVQAREWTARSIDELSTDLKDYVRKYTQ